MLGFFWSVGHVRVFNISSKPRLINVIANPDMRQKMVNIGNVDRHRNSYDVNVIAIISNHNSKSNWKGEAS